MQTEFKSKTLRGVLTILMVFMCTNAYAEIDVFVKDGQGSGRTAHVHPFAGSKNVHAGMLVLQERFIQFVPEFHPFLNDDVGTAMNQAVTFSGTPELITDGGDSFAWVSADVAGTWNFVDTTNCNAGSNCISLTSGNNGDQANFTSADTVTFSNKTAVTGALRLETYDQTLNSIFLQFQSADSNVGDVVDLNDFVDAGLLDAYQNFVITKDDFGITTEEVDEIDITLVRTGGAKPTFRIDTFQIEESGTPLVFKATTPDGTRFHITEIRIAIADVLAGTVANGTMQGLAYNQILAVSALTNGIVFRRVEDGETVFAVPIKQLGDFLATGSNLVNHISDGTNTFITLLVKFPEPIILTGGFENFLSFTIDFMFYPFIYLFLSMYLHSSLLNED